VPITSSWNVVSVAPEVELANDGPVTITLEL
jgi:hypothetical protein